MNNGDELPKDFMLQDISQDQGLLACDTGQLGTFGLSEEVHSSETLVPVVGGSRFPRKGGTHSPQCMSSHRSMNDCHLAAFISTKTFFFPLITCII
jgi:hypothetical protein